jgi:hypothetical protein
MTTFHRTLHAIVSIASGDIVETYNEDELDRAQAYAAHYANVMLIHYRAPLLPAAVPIDEPSQYEFNPERSLYTSAPESVDSDTVQLVKSYLK